MPQQVPADIVQARQNCATDPVHSPGAIQAAGCLISFDLALTRVHQVSANLGKVLGIEAAAALEQTPVQLLGVKLIQRLRKIQRDNVELPTMLVVRRDVGGRQVRLQLTTYTSDDRLVLELEALPGTSRRRPLTIVNQWLKRLARAQTREDLLQQLVAGVHELTGHERVLVYQFDVDWHGIVVAEHCTSGVGRFLGHRFPASDIPPQVRAQYDINPVRSIPDVLAKPVPLLAAQHAPENRSLDLSQGALRAVSPVHLQYLCNMGVGSSLSIAIHGAQRLWGLVACHGLTPKPLTPPLRDAALTLVQMATQRLFLLQARKDALYLERVLNSCELIVGQRHDLVAPDELLVKHGDQWRSLFGACGLALIYRQKISRLGQTPKSRVLKNIASQLTKNDPHGLWCSDFLQDTPLAQAGDLANCCGLMALPLTVESPPGWLMLFRQEQVVIHRWAGNPKKLPVEPGADLSLGPRHSFSTWEEQIKGRSESWLTIEKQAALDLAENMSVAASVYHIERLNAHLREANRNLALLAHTDSLTQVWNRYRSEQALDTELSAAQRYQRPCSLLLFDIDRFKTFNDHHGHEAGDRVLTSLAEEAKLCLRPTDQLGRWGGEEFIVLANNTNLDGAVKLAERLRQHVASLDFGELGQVTISIGVAQWQPGDTRKSLLARADQAMYRAKQAGRNRVMVD